MTALTLTVNGGRVEAEIEPRMHLADLLRERLNLTGTHLGCEQGGVRRLHGAAERRAS